MKFILSIASAVLILMSCSTSPNNTGGSTTTVIPLAPSNLTGVLVSSSQVNLTWTDNSTTETGFKIERRLDGVNFAVVATVNADVLNYSDAGLAANTNYTYRVVSFNAVGSSLTYSNVWSINTGGSIPLSPSNLTGVLVSSSQVNLTWTDNSTNETGFKIERRLDGGNFAVVGTANADVLNYSDAGLAANTNYTYRVVSFNAVGSSLTYSNVWVINTGGTIPTGSTVTICAQVWTTKNLDVTTYRNGDAIPQVTDPTAWANLTTGAWCYYNNDAANGAIYGKLYNWYAVNDTRGLAPTGYHVPSDGEWTTLETCLGGSLVAGGAMKEVGYTHWLSPNTGATNSSGFAGLPGGFRFNVGAFLNVGYSGYWWSSTEDGTPDAWTRALGYYYSSVVRLNYDKAIGFSVRCLRD